MIMDDIKMQNLIIRKNLSKDRIRSYKIIITEYCELTGLTPSELINEAKKEETPYIQDNKIVFTEINERKITKYLFDYYNYIKNKNLSNNTLKTKIQGVRAFYNEYEIQLPKKIEINTVHKIHKSDDLISLKDVKKAVENISNLRNRAIILFMASSGIRSKDIRSFKISDFLTATKEYFNNLDELLNCKNFNNIIPTWEFIPSKTKKNNNVCLTFNTPEATESIVTYLNTRKNLKLDDFLFSTRNNKMMHRATFQRIFIELNNALFFKTSENKNFFHAHGLRKFFISTCNHNSSDIDKVRIMSGHSSNSMVHDAYNSINVDVMKRFYTQLIPFLSVRDTKVRTVTSDDYRRIEKEKAMMSRKIEEQEKQLETLFSMIEELKNKL